MTYIDIDNALVGITKKMCEECRVRLDAIPAENPTEKKAAQLEHGMYIFCGNAGELFNTGWEREKVIGIRKAFFHRVCAKYPRLDTAYQLLNSNEKLCFIAALHAELYIRDQWIPKKESELAAATAVNDAKNVFEIMVMIGAVKNMFTAWEAWRVENNVFPHMFEGDLK